MNLLFPQKGNYPTGFKPVMTVRIKVTVWPRRLAAG